MIKKPISFILAIYLMLSAFGVMAEKRTEYVSEWKTNWFSMKFPDGRWVEKENDGEHFVYYNDDDAFKGAILILASDMTEEQKNEITLEFVPIYLEIVINSMSQNAQTEECTIAGYSAKRFSYEQPAGKTTMLLVGYVLFVDGHMLVVSYGHPGKTDEELKTIELQMEDNTAYLGE